MKLNKWDWIKKEYKTVTIPDSWNCITYSSNMDETVNCAQCGKEVKYGETYCSQEIHTVPGGMGYAVCEDCHKKEMLRRKTLQGW